MYKAWQEACLLYTSSQLDLDNATAAYETAEASVAMSSADLDQAELELGYTIVRSPLAGHILSLIHIYGKKNCNKEKCLAS